MPPTSRPARRLPPEPLTTDEVAALFRACAGPPPAHARNRALLAVLYRAGLRVREALALEPKDLDMNACAVRVLRGKGNRPRTVGIDAHAMSIVGEWLATRAALANPTSTRAIFVTLRGSTIASPMTTSYARTLLTRLGERANIAKRVHPHGLRHTMAAELRAEGVDIAIISRQLGHRSISTTARYLDHLAPLAVLDAMRRRGW